MAKESDSMVKIKSKMNAFKEVLFGSLTLKDLRLMYTRSIQWKQDRMYFDMQCKNHCPKKTTPNIENCGRTLIKVMIFYDGNGVFSFEDRCSNDCRIINSFVNQLLCPWCKKKFLNERNLRTHIGIEVLRHKSDDHLTDLSLIKLNQTIT